MPFIKGHKIWLGKYHTDKTKKKIGKKNKGKIPANKGKKTTFKNPELRKKRIGEAIKRPGYTNKGRFKKGHPDFAKNQKENHPSWQGGKSFEPYTIDWTETLRRSIRERDHYICQLCGKPQGDKTHSVHHIDYNKMNCSPENLITLCCGCNSRVNKNRDGWEIYFLNFKR